MIIVKTNNKERYGVTVTMPGVGTVTPSIEDGTFQHDSEEQVNELLSVLDDFYVQEEDKNLKEDKDAEEKKKLEDLKEKSEQDEVNSSEELINQDEIFNELEEVVVLATVEEPVAVTEASIEIDLATVLSTKTRKELEELCSAFPRKEWVGKNKEELTAFIIDKAQKAS